MNDSDADIQQMPVRFPRSVHEALRLAAFDGRVSMNSLVVEAVRKELGMTEGEK